MLQGTTRSVVVPSDDSNRKVQDAEQDKVAVTKAVDTPLLHAKKGHRPHDAGCDACMRARMRATRATRKDASDTVQGADQGYVLGIDYAGPFDPDVDGNMYALFGVETGHTNYGVTVLRPDRTGVGTLQAVDNIMTHVTTVGPDPKPFVRLHSDDAKEFIEGEVAAAMASKQIRQTHTGGIDLVITPGLSEG